MRLRLPLFTVLVPLAILSDGPPALGQTFEEVSAQMELERLRWEQQVESAKADVALAQKTYKTFYTAAKLDDPSDVAAIDGTLAPLRSRFPDRGLKYETSADYCRVVRTIQSATTSAYRRMAKALGQISELSDQKMILAEIGLLNVSARFNGDPLTIDIISEAFANSVERRRGNEIQTTWSREDYLVGVPDECD
jgi:hypothetical protein